SIKSTEIITGYGILRTTEELVPMLVQRRRADHTAYVWAVTFNGTPAKLTIDHLRTARGKMISRSEALILQVDAGDVHRTLIINPEKQSVDGKTADGADWKTSDVFAVR